MTGGPYDFHHLVVRTETRLPVLCDYMAEDCQLYIVTPVSLTILQQLIPAALLCWPLALSRQVTVVAVVLVVVVGGGGGGGVLFTCDRFLRRRNVYGRNGVDS